VGRPVVMLFLFHAVYATGRVDAIGGYTALDTIHYLILVALCDKLVFHDRALDLSLSIFEGYVTKFLVMPLRYFVLAIGRFVQFELLQLAVVPVLWAVGALAVPRWWPLPASGTALAEALCLVLLALLLSRIDRGRPGLRVMVYAALYASVRLALEALRADAVRGTFGVLSTGQIVSALVLASCAVWLFLRARGPRMQRTAA